MFPLPRPTRRNPQALDGDAALDCIKSLLRLDKSWIPRDEGFSLYLRPTAISTHPFLGVSASDSVKVFVITSPVGEPPHCIRCAGHRILR